MVKSYPSDNEANLLLDSAIKLKEFKVAIEKINKRIIPLIK